MAESTLSLSYDQLCSEVGIFAGYGGGAYNGDVAWDDRQQQRIEAAVRSGLRQFYFPIPVTKGQPSHKWTFLRPTVTLTLAANANELELPDDFGGVDGQVYFTSGLTVPLKLVGEGEVVRWQANYPDQTGQPLCAAVAPIKGTGPRRGQRFKLIVHPKASVSYSLKMAYVVLPDALDGTRPYAYGGMQHTETILAAVKKAFEESDDDNRGIWTAIFMDRLAASIDMDRLMAPQSLGILGTEQYDDGRVAPRTVLFDGVQY